MTPFRDYPFVDLDMKEYFEDLKFITLPGLYKGMPIYLEECGSILLYVEDGHWLLKDACQRYLWCSVTNANIHVQRVQGIFEGSLSSDFNNPQDVVFAFNNTPLAQVSTGARGRIRADSSIEWSFFDGFMLNK